MKLASFIRVKKDDVDYVMIQFFTSSSDTSHKTLLHIMPTAHKAQRMGYELTRDYSYIAREFNGKVPMSAKTIRDNKTKDDKTMVCIVPVTDEEPVFTYNASTQERCFSDELAMTFEEILENMQDITAE